MWCFLASYQCSLSSLAQLIVKWLAAQVVSLNTQLYRHIHLVAHIPLLMIRPHWTVWPLVTDGQTTLHCVTSSDWRVIVFLLLTMASVDSLFLEFTFFLYLSQRELAAEFPTVDNWYDVTAGDCGCQPLSQSHLLLLLTVWFIILAETARI